MGFINLFIPSWLSEYKPKHHRVLDIDFSFLILHTCMCTHMHTPTYSNKTISKDFYSFKMYDQGSAIKM